MAQFGSGATFSGFRAAGRAGGNAMKSQAATWLDCEICVFTREFTHCTQHLRAHRAQAKVRIVNFWAPRPRSLPRVRASKGEDIYKHTQARVCRMMPTHACAAGPTSQSPAHPTPTSLVHAQPPERGYTRTTWTHHRITQNTTRPIGAGGRATPTAHALPPALVSHPSLCERRWRREILQAQCVM